jgi:hypothetical protein
MRLPVSLAPFAGERSTGRVPPGTAPTRVSAGAGMPALPSGGGRWRAARGLPGPSAFSAGTVAARKALAPALPRPPGTVRHVPDSVGSVLLASAVAAGVLANSRGSAWGRLNLFQPGFGGSIGRAGATEPIDRPSRRAAVPGCAPVTVPPAAVLLAATALVRVAVASGRETGRRSQRAAEEGPAIARRLLAARRAAFLPVRGHAPRPRGGPRLSPQPFRTPAIDRSDHAHRRNAQVTTP